MHTHHQPVPLHYKTYGQGDPVIILHGLFGMLDNWMSLGKDLAEHHSVYLVDQRNHGKSPHTESHSYPDLAADLLHFCQQHWLHRTAVIGHSMGGKVAMQFALEHPDIVERLVVVDIAPVAYQARHTQVIAAMRSLDLQTESRQALTDQLMEQLGEASTVLFISKNLTRNKEGGFRWKMNLDTLVASYDGLSGAISSEHAYEGPTLFIRGEQSDYVTDADWQNIVSLFPNATLATVPGAGHWVHADQPEMVLKQIREFLG
ncbi:MAG: alpha/beta fold hydrolase [Saprospiraceae bacterium]|nr:alpha/beta fold hydrolase [Saprospiraceae bacterium]